MRASTLIIVAAIALGGVVQSAAAADCTFAGRSRIRLGTRGQSAADLVVNDPLGRAQLGRNATLADDTAVTADLVGLSNGASVFDVAARLLQAGRGAEVRGTRTEPTLPLDPTFCAPVEVAAGGPAVMARRGDRTITLQPGSFGVVELQNGTHLVLEAGEYAFESIKTGWNVAIEVTGAARTTIAVSGDVRLGNRTTLGPATGTPTPLLRVGGDDVGLGAGSEIEAVIEAPDATVRLGRRGKATGGGCAEVFLTGNEVEFECAEDVTTTTTTSTPSTSSSSSSTSTTTTEPEPTTTTTSSSTTSTLPSSCGDAFLSEDEECDDGNTIPNDGCTECRIDPTLCGSGGIQGVVRLEYDPQDFGIISGMKLQLDMPAVVSVPGSEPFPGAGFIVPDADRVTNLISLAGVLFSPTLRDRNGDGVREGLETIVAVPAHPQAIPPGDIERVHFDCVAGTPVRPSDFVCGLDQVVGIPPNVYDDSVVEAGTDCFMTNLEPRAGTTSTTSISTTTLHSTTTTSTSSTTTTTLFACGNSTIEGPEECDDGNENPADGCTNDCTICGNGTTTAPEACDDGDLDSGDGCDANCTVSACGNGILTEGETCDDGNTANNDACPSNCVIDACTPLLESTRTVAINYAGSSNVAGIVVLVDYPEGRVSILGSGPEGINAVSDIAGDGFAAANDLDHALRVAVNSQTGGALPGGRLFNATFNDCSGAPVPSSAEFTCTVLSASAPNLQPVPGVTCAVVIEGETTTTTTTSTSSTSSTTSTTAPSTTTSTTVAPTTTSSSSSTTSSSTTTSSTVATTSTSVSTTSTTTTSTSSTTSSSSTSSSTTTTTTSSTSTTVPTLCGNGAIDPGETCDDNNTNNADACPSDCAIDTCTPLAETNLRIAVFFTPPPGGLVAGITLLVDYPEGRVLLPATGDTFPTGVITNTPGGAAVARFDFEHALRMTIGRATALVPTTQLFRANFQTCQGAPPATAQDFNCTVLNASDPFINPVAGATCSVTIVP